MSLLEHNSPFNNEDNFDSSFQMETNLEFNKIMESVDERENKLLSSKNKNINLGELLEKDKALQKKRLSLAESNTKPKTKSLLASSPLSLDLQQPQYARNLSSKGGSSAEKDRYSRFSMMSDLSFTFPDVPESPTDPKAFTKTPNQRYSTISNGSSRFVIQKRSNNSLKYRDRVSKTSSGGKRSAYISGATVDSRRTSNTVNSHSSGGSNTNSRIIAPRYKVERSYSNDSSFIGYRNSVRSFSTTVDGSIRFFDAVSINDDDDDDDDDDNAFDDSDMIGSRFSRLKAGAPGIVGVNIVNKNSNIHEIEDSFGLSHGLLDEDVVDDNNSDKHTILSNSTSIIPPNKQKKNLKRKEMTIDIAGAQSVHTATLTLDDDASIGSNASSLPSPSSELLKLSFESLPGIHSPTELKFGNIDDSARGKSRNSKNQNDLLSTSRTKKLASTPTSETFRTSHFRNFSTPANIYSPSSQYSEDTQSSKKKPSNVSMPLRSSGSMRRDNSSNFRSIETSFDDTSDLTAVVSSSSRPSKHNDRSSNFDKSSITNSSESQNVQLKTKKLVKKFSKPFFSNNSNKKSSSDTYKSQSSTTSKIHHKKSFSLTSRKPSDPLKFVDPSFSESSPTATPLGNGISSTTIPLNGNVLTSAVPSTPNTSSSGSGFKFKFHKRNISMVNTNLKEKMFSRNDSTGSVTSYSHMNNSSISTTSSSIFSHENKSKATPQSLASVVTGGGTNNTNANGPAPPNGLFASDYGALLSTEVLAKYGKILLGATPARKIAEENKINYLDLHNLMNLCNSNNNLILEFGDFIQLRLKEIKNKMQFKKYSESPYSEIFIEESLKSKKITNVLKIIPFNAGGKVSVTDSESSLGSSSSSSLSSSSKRSYRTSNDMYSIQSAIQEMSIITKLQNCQGFINLKSAVVVKGEYSKELLKEWDFNHIISQSNLKKKRPDYYKRNQLYLILVLDYGGLTLKDYNVQSWHQANKIFWNLTRVLKTSELLYKFEHRDLNWENVLINDILEEEDDCEEGLGIYKSRGNRSATSFNEVYASEDDADDDETTASETKNKYTLDLRISLIDFAFSRITTSQKVFSMDLSKLVNNSDVIGKLLDDDYRFDVYQLIQQEIKSQMKMDSETTEHNIDIDDSQEINWDCCCPRTNIIWLHYIVDKLITSKNLKPIDKPRSIQHHSKNNIKRRIGESRSSYNKQVTGRGDNTVGQKSILRKPKVAEYLDVENSPNFSKLEQEELFEINEYKSYKALEYLHKSLDPRVSSSTLIPTEAATKSSTSSIQLKSAKHEPFFKSVLDDFGDLFELYKSKYFREEVHFEDFDNLDQILKWGELNELIV
ncbi:hypothetical protein DASC09_042530 [Saccharomycopsis crataegensis]|uniref:non-specific serine/threonine protein kinase n=1 Tax=Saccharomycopsis crataegensis TaxID=43959 RepID=A0AAV5QS00_9ASCO|nr:hypothetical protein DASC09_042530 [Saccharomycopsis crataegensis]